MENVVMVSLLSSMLCVTLNGMGKLSKQSKMVDRTINNGAGHLHDALHDLRDRRDGRGSSARRDQEAPQKKQSKIARLQWRCWGSFMPFREAIEKLSTLQGHEWLSLLNA